MVQLLRKLLPGEINLQLRKAMNWLIILSCLELIVISRLAQPGREVIKFRLLHIHIHHHLHGKYFLFLRRQCARSAQGRLAKVKIHGRGRHDSDVLKYNIEYLHKNDKSCVISLKQITL